MIKCIIDKPMRRTDLAKLLVAATKATERKRLLAENPRLADGRLADEIRKICYAAWTSEPTEAQRASAAAKSLAEYKTTDDIRAIAGWVSGIANITKGRFDEAVDDLRRARRLLTKLGRTLESAQTLVPTLLALAITGRYDEAATAGRTALRIFTAAGDDLAAGKIEMNLSNIAARRSRLREAEKRGLAALRLFVNADEKTWKAMAENSLANTYMELNEFRSAGHFYDLALATARSAKMVVTEAEIEASMGNLATLRGEYAEALQFLELSRRKYAMLAMPHQTAIADLETADIYATLNLHAEANEIYSRVADAFKRLKMRSEEARARLSLGQAAAALGETRAAKREFQRAARLYDAEADDAGRTSVKLAKARLEFSSGRYANAIEALGAVRSTARTNSRKMLAADVLEGESLRRLGELAAAERVLDRAFTLANESGQINFARAAARELAGVAAARGDAKTAELQFRTAIRLTEKMRAPLAAAEFSMAFFADKLDAYDGLARLYIGQGRFAEAFELTENSRSRSLLDAMNAGGEADAISTELAARLGDLRTELNWFYKRLDETDEPETIQKEIDRRERKIAEITRQIGSVGVKKGKRLPHFNLRRLQRQLGNDRTLVEFTESDGIVSAFVANRDGLQLAANICRMADVAADLDDLQFQFGACRFGLANLGKFKHELKRRTDACLARLYDRLFRPLESVVTGSHVIFVPCGTLNFVPFPAMHDGMGYLVERFIVSQTPGAAIWSHLREREPRPIRNALLIGFADERIPLVENEIDALRKQFTGSTVLTGKRATFAAFSAAAPDYDLIHLACHGQFRVDNPMFSSLHLADGWITVRDICTRHLRAGLVTLSACETGLSQVYAGNETLGLVRGFLTAGASALVVSLWTVSDAAAAPLMSDMYAHLQCGLTPAASLRQAQLKFIGAGEHPYLWSPFVAVGN